MPSLEGVLLFARELLLVGLLEGMLMAVETADWVDSDGDYRCFIVNMMFVFSPGSKR